MNIENTEIISIGGEDSLRPEEMNVEEMLRQLEEQKKAIKQARDEKLEKFSQSIAKLRDEAVAARKNSGFEKQWREDEEFYVGVDDLNRGEDYQQYHKPGNGEFVLREVTAKKGNDNQCTAFLNVTAPFVDAAAARCADILLPANDWNFGMHPTPVPEFEDNEDNQKPAIVDVNGNPMASVADLIKERNKAASQKVRKAETRIRDWLTQSNYRRECRKVIDGAALVGSGILKGPFSKKQKSRAYIDGKMIHKEEINPGVRRVSHWNFYPDFGGGEDVQEGDYVFERDFMYARSVIELKGMGYIDSAIDKVIAEGPGKRNDNNDGRPRETNHSDQFVIWYCYKYITSADLRLIDEEYDKECSCNVDDDGNEIQGDMKPFLASIMMINDTIIYANKWPIPDEGFPFEVFVWQRVAGNPFGIGVARQGRTAQRTVTAAFRKLMINQGLAAIPMLAMIRSAIKPIDGNWNLYGGKQFDLLPNKGVKDIREAMQFLQVPSMQEGLAALIQFGMKSMEDATGITFLMQGQQGSAPDTVGGMQMMLQSSSTLLRRITRVYDECTVKLIERFYSWLLIYGEDDEKGDYQISATGSSSLLEREIQAMQLPQMLQFSINPAYGISPKKTMDETIKSMRFDPVDFELDEAEKQAAAKSQPTDPRLEVAKLNADKDMQIAKLNAQIKQLQIQSDTDRDAVFNQGVSERTQADRQSHIEELQLKKDLALLEYATQQRMQLEDIKAKLADSSMKLSVQKELASMDDSHVKQVLTPPSEPPQQAKPGEAYQQ